MTSSIGPQQRGLPAGRLRKAHSKALKQEAGTLDINRAHSPGGDAQTDERSVAKSPQHRLCQSLSNMKLGRQAHPHFFRSQPDGISHMCSKIVRTQADPGTFQKRPSLVMKYATPGWLMLP
jgi:hypothetical protein